MASIVEIRRAALEALRPPPKLALSGWIERHLVLPEGASAQPGKVRLWPYQRGIADAIGDPAIERVTLVKAVRVGFTTLLIGAIGSFVANEPCPVLVLLPTEADARDYTVSDIEPIFQVSPLLRGTLSDDAPEGERNTLLSKRFAGGSLKIISARSPRNLRHHTCRVLVVDEADACEVGREGDPLRLAERRTLSFPNRKIIIGSTPLFEGTSAVLRAYAQSDGRIFECPCPSCSSFVELQWSMIEWPPDDPSQAAFRCPACGVLAPEVHKTGMVREGRWRPTVPGVANHAGFRLSALVSLYANASWGRLAAEFLQAKDDPAQLQVFTNTILAQGWKGEGEEVDEGALASRGEPFGLDRFPSEVLVVTCGVDVQDDRLECAVCGWTREGGCLILDHRVIWGAIDDDTTWQELECGTFK
jgi:phage terminase large subunit GpA-like protein